MAEKKKKIINLLDWRSFPSKCKNRNSQEDEGDCFYIEKVTNSVKFVTGTFLPTVTVKKLSKKEIWTVNIRAPKDSDFKS